MKNPDISIIIPVWDESDNIINLINEIHSTFKESIWIYEVVIVDDGSEDGTTELVRKIAEKDEKIRNVHLREHLGKSAALWCGFQHGKGKYFATIDGDCQNDPNDITRLLLMIQNGQADFVHGMRSKRQDNAIRMISSKIANNIRNFALGFSVKDSGCAFNVFKKECVRNIPVFEGMHRFLPELVRNVGFAIDEVPVNHRKRMKGVAKYGVLNRLLVGLWDLIGVHWYLKRSKSIQWES